MKTLKFSLIGIFLFSSLFFNSSAIAKNPADSSATILRAELIKLIQNPELKAHGITDAEIQLQFSIGPKGEIQVVKIEAENDYLKNFVQKKIDHQKISNQDIRKDMIYYLTIRFELD